MGAIVALPSDDDGYISPDFDLPELSSEDEDTFAPPSKRNKTSYQQQSSLHAENTVEDDEELALRLLRNR